MDERNDARRSIEASRTHLTEIAEELSRRTSGDYLKGRAREMAMEKVDRAKSVASRAGSRPGALGTIGALAGAGLGIALARKNRSRREAEAKGAYVSGGGFRTGSTWVSKEYVGQPAYGPGPDYSASPEVEGAAGRWSEPFPSAPESTERREYGEWRGSAEEGWSNVDAERSRSRPGFAERLKEKSSSFRGRASNVRERVAQKAADVKQRFQERSSSEEPSHRFEEMKAKASHLRERLPSTEELKEKIPSASRIRETSQQRPTGLILGGIALGAVAASLIPLTRREQKVMHPARERAREQFSNLEHRIEDRFGVERKGEAGSAERSERKFSEPRKEEPSGTSYGTATSDVGRERVTPRSDLGLKENEAPYRQPSLDQQLEDQNKDKYH